MVDARLGQRAVGRGADLGAQVADHGDQLVPGDLDADEELPVGPDGEGAGGASGAGAGALGRGELFEVAHLDERPGRLGDGGGGQVEAAGEGDAADRALGQHGREDGGDRGRDGVYLRKHG